MKDFLGVIIVVVLFLSTVLGAALATKAFAVRDCKHLSDETGRPTKYYDKTCHIEIAPNLWVEVEQVAYFLDHVKPLDDLHSQ